MKIGVMVAGACGLALMINSNAFAGDAAKGKTIYERHCVTCHGVQGKGDGPAGKFMNPKPVNFTSPESMNKPDAELLKTIESGRPGTPMGAWKGTLSPEQMQDVLAYVRSLGK